MFYYSAKSKDKVVHYGECHHLKNIRDSNLKTFENVRDVLKNNYKICSCCSPIIKCLNKEKYRLEEYCQENGLLYFSYKGILHIRTHHSKWKIITSDSGYTFELHHENLYENDYEDSIPGYHKQNFSSESLYSFFEYINNHEYYRMLNPIIAHEKKSPPKRVQKDIENSKKFWQEKSEKGKY